MANLKVQRLNPPHKDGAGVVWTWRVVNLDDKLPSGEPNTLFTSQTKEEADAWATAATPGVRRGELLSELAGLEA